MNTIASLFLRAKHWQLFVLSVTLSLVELLVLRQHLSAAEGSAVVRGAVTALDIAFLLAWVWSVGSFLNSVVRPSLRLDMPLFYFTLTIPLLYAALSFVLNEHSPLAILKIAFRVLAVVCTIYDVGFVAESLVRAETDKPASFTEVATQFFLIWFFVFGVWSVQPRINRLYVERTKGPTPDQPVRQGAIQSPG